MGNKYVLPCFASSILDDAARAQYIKAPTLWAAIKLIQPEPSQGCLKSGPKKGTGFIFPQ